MKYFTSDWHIGHEGILKFSHRPFKNIGEMDNFIIENVLNVLKYSDDLFFLGDIGLPGEALDKFFSLFPKRANFHWIKGNHDKKALVQYRKKATTLSEIKDTFIGVGPEQEKQKITLCHYPMLTWNCSHHGAWQLFGHHHILGLGINELKQKTRGKMFNVNLEFNNYKMYTEEDLVRIMENKSNNWDLIE